MFTLNKSQFTDITQAEVLRDRCDQILKEIQSGNNGIPEHIRGDSYRELKDQYNRLSNQLENLRSRPFVDPLLALPPEIWTDILREAAIGNGINLSSSEILLTFTSVSRYWNTTLLNTATLWTDLAVGLGEADAQAKLGVGLYLSRDLPLKLLIYVPPCQWDGDLELLLPHANRIQEMEFLDSKRRGFPFEGKSKSIEQIISSLAPLTSLKSIRSSLLILRPLPNWQDIFANTPILASIYGTPIPLSVLKPRTGLLRSCHVEATWSEIIPYIKELALLEDLTWHVYPEETETKISSSIVTKLPGLRQISTYINPDANLFTVMKLAGNLTSLMFRLPDNWQPLYDIFRLFPRLPLLRRVHVFMSEKPGKLVWPATEITGTNVTELFISYSGSAHKSEETLNNQETFFAVLPLYFPNVTQFHVRFTVYSAGVAAYIRSAERLVSLGLFLMQEPEYEVSLESSSLRALKISGGDNLLAGLANFTCPLLSRLSLEAGIGRPKITSSQALGKIHELRALRKIQVSDYDRIISLFLSLIFNPNGYPALAEIELCMIPEWDLLFILLERRNYIPRSQGIARIETVTLPSPIPPVLLVPLVELLAGRFTERPSNLDLSFLAFMEAYCDPSISGCRRCLKSLLTCTVAIASLDPFSASFWRPTKLPGIESTEFSSGGDGMPADVWKWLQERKGRVGEWSRRRLKKKGSPKREDICTEMMLAQRPFIVTSG